MSARYRLEQWFKKFDEPDGRMTREDVCFLMVQSRHLIETSGTPDKYRVTAFYADWTVHTALDRSPLCFEMLRDIAGVLAVNMGPTSAELPSLISRVIGLPQLRAELMTLFRSNELPVALFEYYQNWKAFTMFLLWHVGGQPIGWPGEPGKRARAIRNEMLALVQSHSFAVEGLNVVIHEEKYHWVLQVSQTDKVFSIVGGVDGIEGPDAFTPPPA